MPVNCRDISCCLVADYRFLPIFTIVSDCLICLKVYYFWCDEDQEFLCIVDLCLALKGCPDDGYV